MHDPFYGEPLKQPTNYVIKHHYDHNYFIIVIISVT